MLNKDEYNNSSAVAEMGDRGHNRHGTKREEAAESLSRGGAGSPSNTMSLGLSHSYLRTKWHAKVSS